MKIIDFSNTEANIILNKNELIVINAALNEICNGIELFEFETRIGTDREHVLALLNLVNKLLDKVEKDDRK
ncbi:MAG: hypothetical protein LBC08_02920 [Campylobacteraceae bacterium]|jgi:hypothetical protein|nr:hypothetical protein [Campylobacteraceae bacterium]